MKKRGFSFLLAFSMLFLLLAGCGGKTDPADTTSAVQITDMAQETGTMQTAATTATAPVQIVDPAIYDEIRTLYQISKAYTYTDTSSQSVEDIADILLRQMMDDLKTEEEGRTFVIVDYSLDYNVEDNFFGNPLGDDMWYVSGGASVTFTGILSPIGSSESAPDDTYFSLSFGDRFLVRDGQTYTLYNDSYYFEWLEEQNGE